MKKVKVYGRKFANFISLCRRAKTGDVVIVASPNILGDNYEELIESLNRLADAGAMLAIAFPHFCGKAGNSVTVSVPGCVSSKSEV